MINSLNLNAVQNLLNFDITGLSNYSINSSQVNDSYIADTSDITLDAEAQELMSTVGQDLHDNQQEAVSVHEGLNYSRVMQLVEGL